MSNTLFLVTWLVWRRKETVNNLNKTVQLKYYLICAEALHSIRKFQNRFAPSLNPPSPFTYLCHVMTNRKIIGGFKENITNVSKVVTFNPSFGFLCLKIHLFLARSSFKQIYIPVLNHRLKVSFQVRFKSKVLRPKMQNNPNSKIKRWTERKTMSKAIYINRLFDKIEKILQIEVILLDNNVKKHISLYFKP